MEMEAVCKELDELKHAMEVLRDDCQVKSKLLESLRRAHDEQNSKLQEAKATVEKQTQELAAKSEEINLSRIMYEDVNNTLLEKELLLKNLSLANDNIRMSSRERVMKLEEENKTLISALDEANSRREDGERKLSSCKKEIEELRIQLVQSQKKCSDAEEKAHVLGEVRRREEMIQRVERENEKLEDKLKWKNEQFRHLEEAHCKLQDEFQSSKKVWELEKCGLHDEISSLQMNLDLQKRAVEDFRSRLEMCNQALAHEESRRKLLEIQMSEFETRYENVVMEYEEVRSSIDVLTAKRDEEIATLRNSLATKEACFKEMEFRNDQLEQDNIELRSSLKEFQEAQINAVEATASLKTLRQKFRVLEQKHRSCSEEFRAKEAEWSTQTEKLRRDLDECTLKLSGKNTEISELQLELESTNSLLLQQKLENEEMSIVLAVFKSALMESYMNLESLKFEIERRNAKQEERIACLMEQLDKKNCALVLSQSEIKLEHEMVLELQRKMECVESVNLEHVSKLKELDIYKEKLEESSRSFSSFKDQVSQKESELQENMRRVSDALDDANSALAEKSRELDRCNSMLAESSQSFSRFKEKACMKEKALQEELNTFSDALEKAKFSLAEKTREHDMSKVLLVESSGVILRLKEQVSQASQKENDLQEELKKATVALNQANSTLADKTSEAAKFEYQMLEIKSVVEKLERLRSDLEIELSKTHDECIAVRKDLDACTLEKMMAEEKFMQEKNGLKRDIKEKDMLIKELQQQIVIFEEHQARQSVEDIGKVSVAEDEYERLKCQEQEYAAREVEISAMIEQEKAKFLEAMKEKECVIYVIQQQVSSLKRAFAELAEAAGSLKPSDMRFDNGGLHDTLEKIVSTHILDKLDLQYKSLLLVEAEKESLVLQKKLEIADKLSFDSKKEKLEAENKTVEIEKELKCLLSNNCILKGEIETLNAVIEQFSSAGEKMEDDIVCFTNLVMDLSNSEKELAKFLKNINAQDEEVAKSCCKEDNNYQLKNNKILETFATRLPLKEQNF
ncbi:uncharacterized protein At4g38062 [Dioscorea cayenensis subsp. rotundata]|uniref:Uncharacterized protein At4g38062 n=1 Tax=Dioscorea cayennensis subsp. rotundata TaxID=55577 RepID=A0AB40BWD1_DIOCR|nr:uncharacterized protein At4g38062 [Dioscorea cayenensis subsp. rotundata]XP_039131408.1 uncharacterized protein At4g38062 [Dioscorea cayenensis subsp. rotundata]XP_039131409.1 uncharacterized protein At4g38062 [Dioscorea cayenensis subsp. rotundata]